MDKTKNNAEKKMVVMRSAKTFKKKVGSNHPGSFKKSKRFTPKNAKNVDLEVTQTIGNILREHRFKVGYACISYELFLTNDHKKKRLEWAKKYCPSYRVHVYL